MWRTARHRPNRLGALEQLCHIFKGGPEPQSLENRGRSNFSNLGEQTAPLGGSGRAMIAPPAIRTSAYGSSCARAR
jgi:hypothetical protein